MHSLDSSGSKTRQSTLAIALQETIDRTHTVVIDCEVLN
jgi:hypothetical protein